MSKETILFVKVTPKAAITKIIGWEEQELRIKLAAVPEKGQANKELIRFLAKQFHLRQENVEILSGETSRKKKIKMIGITLEELKNLL